jgi:hypothetical protein
LLFIGGDKARDAHIITHWERQHVRELWRVITTNISIASAAIGVDCDDPRISPWVMNRLDTLRQRILHVNPRLANPYVQLSDTIRAQSFLHQGPLGMLCNENNKFPRSLFIIELPTPLIVHVCAFLTIHDRLMWLGGSPERNRIIVAYWRKTHVKQLQRLLIENVKIVRVSKKRHHTATETGEYRIVGPYFDWNHTDSMRL